MPKLSKVDDVRLCRSDNWHQVLGDSVARAVRWARRQDRFSNQVWTKWHYTEGNGAFTACGTPVVAFETDGSPQEQSTGLVNCRRCLSVIVHQSLKLR